MSAAAACASRDITPATAQIMVEQPPASGTASAREAVGQVELIRLLCDDAACNSAA